MRISSVVRDLKPSGIRKFFDLAEQDPDVISLGVGEPDFVTPEVILKAGQKCLADGITHYTSNDGSLALRRKLSEYLKHRLGLDYKFDGEIIITVGASEAVDIALATLISPGDEVLIPEPCFVSYAPCTALCGGVPKMVPTLPGHGFKITAEELEKYVTSRTRALLLSYPNNPTGAVMSRRELEPIADFVRKHELAVVSDEVYAELTYGIKHVSIASLPGMKDLAMTGWRIGYLCGPMDGVQQARKVHQYRVMCPPTVSQAAALEALNSGEPEVKRMVDEYDRRRKALCRGLRDMGFDLPEPQGAFYVFPSVGHTGLSGEEFAESLLEKAKVAVVPGSAFGPSGHGHIRCSYATSMENINEALNRIQAFVNRLPQNIGARHLSY